MADPTRNKSLVRNHIEALNRHDIEAAMAFAAPNVVNHAAIPEARGLDGMRTIFTKLWKAMPDQQFTCEDLIAEDDRVVCRLTMRGTQTGPLEMTRMPLPATGRTVETEQIHVFRIVDDKIVEHWAGRDDIGFLRQLGHAPFNGKPAS